MACWSGFSVPFFPGPSPASCHLQHGEGIRLASMLISCLSIINVEYKYMLASSTDAVYFQPCMHIRSCSHAGSVCIVSWRSEQGWNHSDQRGMSKIWYRVYHISLYLHLVSKQLTYHCSLHAQIWRQYEQCAKAEAPSTLQVYCNWHNMIHVN